MVDERNFLSLLICRDDLALVAGNCEHIVQLRAHGRQHTKWSTLSLVGISTRSRSRPA